MRSMRLRLLPWLLLLVVALPAVAQEQESLGDIARKNRERKRQEEEQKKQQQEPVKPPPAEPAKQQPPPQPAKQPPPPPQPENLPSAPEKQPEPVKPRPVPEKQPPEPAKKPPAPGGWVDFSTSESHFHVLFPAMPTESEQADGRQFMVDLGNRAYVVTYARVPMPSNPAHEEFLDAVASHMAESFVGTVRDVTPICVSGHPGRSVRVDKADGTLTSRVKFIWVNGAQAYILTYGSATLDVAGEADGRRFLDSFQLLPQTPAADVEWRPLSSTAGGFRALFPGEPQEKSGGDMHMFGVEYGSSNYTVRYADLPESAETPDQLLDGERDETLRSLAATLVGTEGRVAFEGHPARQRKVQARCGNVIFDRLVLVGHRIYDVRVSASGELAGSADIPKFLGSFHLLPPPKP
jgi:hypothetical protein